jgi:hypothetical protein
MDTESYSSGWLMLLTQLPSKPSIVRVALWRHMRAAGATAMVNRAWALPCSVPYTEFFEPSRESIIGQGGIGFVLRVSASSQETNEAIVRLFRADRAREYDEFAERCTAFLNEINRESNAGKYTFCRNGGERARSRETGALAGEDPSAGPFSRRAQATVSRSAGALPE